ncbi:MAG: translocation/assembly module TamB domain-containing protein [Bacteroidetes bacterium]|nr:translocation/assembly module TamB domain-containing protein [Bacteroidota bacterium]
MNWGKVVRITLKVLGGVVGALLILLLVFILLIRLPSVQNFITHKATAYISSKTHTRISLRRLYIGFPKSVVIEQLYAEDAKHDTLLYLGELEVGVNMLGLLHHKLEIGSIRLSDVTANIGRSRVDSAYNFGFFIRAFAGDSKKAPEVKPASDTTHSTPWKVQVNNVDLVHIRARFADSVSGTIIRGEVGTLRLRLKGMDLKPLSFAGHELYLADTRVDIVQTRDNDAVKDSTTALLPQLGLDKLDLKNIHFSYRNQPGGQLYSFDVGALYIQPEQIDLNQHIIKVKTLHLVQSDGSIAMRRADTTASRHTAPLPHDTAAGRGWYVNADTIHLEHIDFAFDETDAPRVTAGMDYRHLKLTDVNTHIEHGYYSPDTILADIHHLSARERCGIVLRNLTADGQYTSTGGILHGLTLTTDISHIEPSDIAVHYGSLRSLSTDIGDLTIHADLHPASVDVQDILWFAPQLRATFDKMHLTHATVSGKITGQLKDLTAQHLSATVGRHTAANIDAHIIGLPKAVTAYYDVELHDVHSTEGEISAILNGVLPPSIQLPQTVAVTGHVKGSLKDAAADLDLNTSNGSATINATMRMAAGDTQYAVKLTANALDLGYILRKPDLLGPVTMTASGKGQNLTPATIIADLDARIAAVYFKKYTYKNIDLSACASEGAYDATILIHDTNVQMGLEASLLWQGEDKHLIADGNISGIDLLKTHLMAADLRAGARLNIDMRDSSHVINGDAVISNITVLKGEDTYRIDSIALSARTDTGRLRLVLSSDIADLTYDGTPKVQLIPSALISFVNTYFAFTPDRVDTSGADTTRIDFDLTASVNPHPILTEVLMPQVKAFNGASLSATFDKARRKLDLDLNASAMAYGGIKIDNAGAAIHAVNDSLKYDISVARLANGPIRLISTELSGSLRENRLAYLLDVKDSVAADKLKMSGELRQPEPKSYTLRIDSNGLVLNDRKWALADDNKIHFGKGGLYVHDFDLRRNAQEVAISSQSDDGAAPIKVTFRDFDIGTISQIIESDTALLRGRMNGNAELRNVNTSPAFVSDLRIDSISYQQHPIGDLTVKADNLTADRYQADVRLSGADNDVQIRGAYISTAAGGSQLDLHTSINKLNLSSIEPFTAGQIRRSKGYMTGNASISGSIKHPLINADIAFRDAATNVAYINNYITIKEDHIKVDPNGIYFHSFDILDSLGQKATIDGSVHTTDFKKMKFDLTIRTDHFTVLNTTIRDNPLFFGHLLISSRISVKGNESLPVVNADVKLLDHTNIAVIIPTSKISTDRGDGIVVMVDHSDTTGILGKRRDREIDTVSTQLQFKGINLIANVDIAKQAKFKVIVNKTSGDSLVVNGEGRLSFALDPAGNQNLTGTYTLSGGSYDFSFEKVIHKKFNIRDGSTITWNGRPQDATVDVSAIYEVRTSAADLLASELAGVSESEKSAYKKLLHFKVYLNMKGELLKPEISFRLDMNDADKAAFSGIVYSKVTSVNGNPDELNKQVFALLILNRFIPTNTVPGDDYGTVATDFARNSVNEVLTDQLNRLSGKYIKGVDLNFGLQSNDEYTQAGVQQNTQVSIGVKKSFFKDRLDVSLGTSINVPNSNSSASQYNANSITGDIMLDYKLTPDGRYHFKAFRLNQYEGIIDGLLYKTGIGVSYNRDYDHLKDIFQRHPKPKTEAPVQ